MCVWLCCCQVRLYTVLQTHISIIEGTCADSQSSNMRHNEICNQGQQHTLLKHKIEAGSMAQVAAMPSAMLLLVIADPAGLHDHFSDLCKLLTIFRQTKGVLTGSTKWIIPSHPTARHKN